MLQRVEVHLVSHHSDVEQRSGKQFSGQNTCLVQMQSSWPRKYDRAARIDANGLVALAVKVRKPAGERLQNVLDAPRIVLPGIGGGVFQVEHHAGSAGI